MEKYVAYIFVGFDFLGCAVDSLGDSVSLSVHLGQISISHISGDPCSKLSRSGLESSAASAAAVAVNEIFGGKLGSEELVLVGLKSEEKVSGYHADNVGPVGNLRLYSVFDC